jgi:uncharacterized protein with HEPN domain
MSDRSQKLYLEDIVEPIEEIESFVVDMDLKTFAGDRKTFAATVRELEIIGEAVRNISDEIKTRYPNVLWQEIRAFRNMITHEYFGIDVKIVWDVVRNELGTLKQQAKRKNERSTDCPRWPRSSCGVQPWAWTSGTCCPVSPRSGQQPRISSLSLRG